MADLHLLNIDPGYQTPVVDGGSVKQGMNVTPDCPDCGANKYMHQSPDMDTVQLVCMGCGAVHNVVGVKVVTG